MESGDDNVTAVLDPMFAEVDEDDLEEDSTPVNDPPIPLLEAQRGRCRVCGNPAKDGRSYYCETDLPVQFRTVGTLAKPNGGKGAAKDPEIVRKKAIKNKYQKWILTTGNPNLVKGCQLITGVPDEWMGDVEFQSMGEDGQLTTIRLWEPSLSEQFALTKTQAGFMAGALVEFTESNPGKAVMAMITTMTPYIAIVGALGVVGVHAVKLAGIKKSVEMLKQQQMEQVEQQKQMMAAMAGMGQAA